MIKYILAFSLICSVANATDQFSVMKGIYADDKGKYSLLLGDQHLFDQTSLVFAFPHYGGGKTQMQVGNNFGLHMSSNSGFIINGLDVKQNNTVAPMIGFEPMNGRIQANTSTLIPDYYEGNSGVSFGPQIDIKGFRTLPIIKGGLAYGTLGKYGLVPRVDLMRGYGIHTSYSRLKLSYTKVIFNKYSMQDAYGMYRFGEYTDLGLGYDNTKGVVETNSYSILLRVEFE